jgi:hypothetical protein
MTKNWYTLKISPIWLVIIQRILLKIILNLCIIMLVGIDGDWDVKIRQIGSHNNEELNVYHTSKCFGMCNNVL